MDKAPDAFRTISEVAAELSISPARAAVLGKPLPRNQADEARGGRRFYRPQDVDLLRGIRHLLYGEGYTIRGVQRILREQGQKFVQNVWQPGAPQPAPSPADRAPEEAAESVDREWEQEENGADSEGTSVAPAPPVLRSTLSEAHVHKLQSILDELAECRRLLDGALTERSEP